MFKKLVCLILISICFCSSWVSIVYALYSPKTPQEDYSDVMDLDLSSVSKGYFKLNYKGDSDGVSVCIGKGDEVSTYRLSGTGRDVFPLSHGDGHYNISLFERVDGGFSVPACTSVDVVLDSEFAPFLVPNQYVWYDDSIYDIDIQGEGMEFVSAAYEYVINTLEYDDEKAASIVSGELGTDYLPDIDKAIDSGKGICVDYASLFAALLRSRGIPVKVQLGRHGDTGHAWCSVYINGSWRDFDPTLGDGGDRYYFDFNTGDDAKYVLNFSS